MTADIIPFPKPPSYLDYCHSPEARYHANAIFEIFARHWAKDRAERMTRDLLKKAVELRSEPPLPPDAS